LGILYRKVLLNLLYDTVTSFSGNKISAILLKPSTIHLMQHIILFDGECVLCNWAAKFVLTRDKNKQFSFVSLQSEEGKNILSSMNIVLKKDDETIILVEGNHWYTHSKAALRISKSLSGLWPLFYVFIIIPSPVRDLVYRFIGRHRYQWFGKVNTCDVQLK